MPVQCDSEETPCNETTCFHATAQQTICDGLGSYSTVREAAD